MQCYLKKAEIPEDTATLGKKKQKNVSLRLLDRPC